MLDLIAALRWVNDNIAAFGGDPGNVTVFGESGGGGKVSALLAMPAAKGLFHRAIIRSGAAIRVSTRERANALAAQALRELGLRGHECERLLEHPPDRILAAIAPAVRALGRSRWPLLDRYDFGPLVDGADLPQHPCEPEAPGIGDCIPLLVGGTREESAFFLADDDQVWNGVLSETELRQRVAAITGAEADAVLAVPEWPAYTQAERITMVFDDECRITRDPDRDAHVLWTRLVKG
jgi:para-nitrobenzyl esterase